MSKFSRRDWLRSTGILGSAALLAGSGSIAGVIDQEKAFHPRPISNPLRLNSNENPYGPSEKVRQVMRDNFSEACRYPFAYTDSLLSAIAAKEGVSKDHIVITGGSTEGLKITGLAYGWQGGDIVAPRPTFLSMTDYAAQFGTHINWVPVDENMGLDLDEMEKRVSARTRVVFLCNPNNPTSTLVAKDRLMDFCDTVSRSTLLFSDEAYYDFIEEKNYPSMVELVKKGRHVVVSRTFSKVYGLAGLRIGYLVARPDIAAMLEEKVVAFTNVLALLAAEAALKDQEFYNFSLNKNRESKKAIYATLDELGLKYVPSHTNFVFFKTGRDIRDLIPQMLAEGVRIGRPFPPFYDWCRISTGTDEEIRLFNKALKKVMK